MGRSGVRGEITLSQVEGKELDIKAKVSGLAPGLHGFHIHAKGDLSDGCASTGGYYKVDGLTSLKANKKGIVDTDISDSLASLMGKNSILGRSLVI